MLEYYVVPKIGQYTLNEVIKLILDDLIVLINHFLQPIVSNISKVCVSMQNCKETCTSDMNDDTAGKICTDRLPHK
ncbi:unnamed protein product [Heterobilharzia americana]|nr:unnamed protein product [Heterobilharzia americana]